MHPGAAALLARVPRADRLPCLCALLRLPLQATARAPTPLPAEFQAKMAGGSFLSITYSSFIDSKRDLSQRALQAPGSRATQGFTAWADGLKVLQHAKPPKKSQAMSSRGSSAGLPANARRRAFDVLA
jgi:hypothetical protein